MFKTNLWQRIKWFLFGKPKRRVDFSNVFRIPQVNQPFPDIRDVLMSEPIMMTHRYRIMLPPDEGCGLWINGQCVCGLEDIKLSDGRTLKDVITITTPITEAECPNSNKNVFTEHCLRGCGVEEYNNE